MILTLTNKTTYTLNQTEAKAILEAINADERYAIVQGDYIMLNAIVAIQDEERTAEADHLRNGDYKCVHGRWHMRGDRCYGHDVQITFTPPLNRLREDNRTPEEQYAAAREKSAEVRQKMHF